MMGAPALLNVEGQLNLSNLVITFSGPFHRECLLNDYIVYLRTYEKRYYVTVKEHGTKIINKTCKVE